VFFPAVNNQEETLTPQLDTVKHLLAESLLQQKHCA